MFQGYVYACFHFYMINNGSPAPSPPPTNLDDAVGAAVYQWAAANGAKVIDRGRSGVTALTVVYRDAKTGTAVADLVGTGPDEDFTAAELDEVLRGDR